MMKNINLKLEMNRKITRTYELDFRDQFDGCTFFKNFIFVGNFGFSNTFTSHNLIRKGQLSMKRLMVNNVFSTVIYWAIHMVRTQLREVGGGVRRKCTLHIF